MKISRFALTSNVISAAGTGGAEITAAGYAEIDVVKNTTNFPPSTLGTRSNAVKQPAAFLEITEDFTVLSLGFFKTTGGGFLGRKVFDTPFEVYDGQSYGFPIGSIYFTPQNPS